LIVVDRTAEPGVVVNVLDFTVRSRSDPHAVKTCECGVGFTRSWNRRSIPANREKRTP
jgi:hypothetical protein